MLPPCKLFFIFGSCTLAIVSVFVTDFYELHKKVLVVARFVSIKIVSNLAYTPPNNTSLFCFDCSLFNYIKEEVESALLFCCKLKLFRCRSHLAKFFNVDCLHMQLNDRLSKIYVLTLCFSF